MSQDKETSMTDFVRMMLDESIEAEFTLGEMEMIGRSYTENVAQLRQRVSENVLLPKTKPMDDVKVIKAVEPDKKTK